TIDRNWRGEAAPAQLRTIARLLWDADDIFIGFECEYTELDMDGEFDLNEERQALWERDVCEAFIRSPLEPHERIYKEFEVAPTGQWCDLIVDRSALTHDWKWRSGMRTASRIDEKSWSAVMAIPFTAFGLLPNAGDVWKANLFRIGRLAGERQYLTFSPTFTEIPNFHAPEKFVDLLFIR
ncbi:MAG: carbohydrate-binding family 9-like protein, partial [Blastocatellia bacterium]|nr:carbohydrate-binding family 9-like protein [Blastocatellia bacterium]